MAIDSTGSRITFGGLASGLDTNALIEALIQAERAPLRRLEARRADVSDQQSRFRDLNSRLLRLREAASAIDNRISQLEAPSLDEEFLAFQAETSDEAVLTATADGTGTATAGSFAVRVEQLATAAREVSAAYSSASDTVGSDGDTLSIDFGGESTIDITITSSTTVQSLRDEINAHADNDGSVRAELLDDGSGSVRLVISGTQTGADNDLSITTTLTAPGGGSFLDASLSQDAQDARLRVFGVTITRSSNDVSDAIPGITLHLAGVNDPNDTSDEETVTVDRDDEAVATKLQELVDAYNDVRDFARAQVEVDSDTNRAGPLSGNAVVRSLEQQVRQVVGDVYSFTGNPFSTLSEIGVRFDADGRLSLDQTVLSAALDEDPLAVRQLLSGDGTADGAATALARSLDPVIRSGDGTLARIDSNFSDRLDQLDDSIARMEDRIARREELLIQRFTELERLVTAFQSQSTFLNGLGR